MALPSSPFLLYTAKYTLQSNTVERFSGEWNQHECNHFFICRVIVLRKQSEMRAGECMHQSEENLAALLVNDLNRNFERLVLAYQERLYAFALSRTGNAQAAEEIVQIAFERAYFALKKYPARRIQLLKLEPWLYEITRNTIHNHMRDSRTHSARISSIPLDLSKDNPLFDIQDQSLEPAEELCRRENRRELEEGLMALPISYQATLKLYYFDNLTSREIAERLHQPPGTVKANIHRGTLMLRKALEAYRKEAR